MGNSHSGHFDQNKGPKHGPSGNGPPFPAPPSPHPVGPTVTSTPPNSPTGVPSPPTPPGPPGLPPPPNSLAPSQTTSDDATLGDQSTPLGTTATSDGSSSEHPEDSATSSSSATTVSSPTSAIKSSPDSASSTISTETDTLPRGTENQALSPATSPFSPDQAGQSTSLVILPGSTSSNSVNGSQQANTSPNQSKTGPIIGAVVGGIIVALLLLVIPVAIILRRRRRRDRSFTELEDPVGEPVTRWSAVYAAAVGYDLNRTDSASNLVPAMPEAYYGTSVPSSEGMRGVNELPAMVHITAQMPVVNIHHEDTRQSLAYGHSPALAVTIGDSIKGLHDDLHAERTTAAAQGWSASSGSTDNLNIDNEVAEIMQTLHARKKVHGSGESSPSSTLSEAEGTYPDVAGPSYSF